MTTVHLEATSLLARALEVGTRVPEQVADTSSGLLLETMLGRYVVDEDGERVWLLIDGRRTLGEIARLLAESSGRPVQEIDAPLHDFLEELARLGLVEVLAPQAPAT